MKKTPLRKVSAKRAKENREYSKLRKAFLEEHQWCAVNPLIRATQIHHRYSRRGKWLNETSLWLAVSAEGHQWIHENGREARKRGWIIDKP